MRIIHDKQLCRDAADVDRWLYSFIIRRLSEVGRALLARLAHAGYGGSSNPFEDPPVVFGATSIEDVTLNVFIPEYPLGINFLEDADEVVEARIELA